MAAPGGGEGGGGAASFHGHLQQAMGLGLGASPPGEGGREGGREGGGGMTTEEMIEGLHNGFK